MPSITPVSRDCQREVEINRALPFLGLCLYRHGYMLKRYVVELQFFSLTRNFTISNDISGLVEWKASLDNKVNVKFVSIRGGRGFAV